MSKHRACRKHGHGGAGRLSPATKGRERPADIPPATPPPPDLDTVMRNAGAERQVLREAIAAQRVEVAQVSRRFDFVQAHAGSACETARGAHHRINHLWLAGVVVVLVVTVMLSLLWRFSQ